MRLLIALTNSLFTSILLQIDNDFTARINMADYKFSFHEKHKEYSPAWMSPEGEILLMWPSPNQGCMIFDHPRVIRSVDIVSQNEITPKLSVFKLMLSGPYSPSHFGWFWRQLSHISDQIVSQTHGDSIIMELPQCGVDGCLFHWWYRTGPSYKSWCFFIAGRDIADNFWSCSVS